MKLKFNVTGMTCAACSARVEKVTNAVPGVEKAEVNLLAGTMQVEVENGNVVPAIIKAVQDAGYNAALPGEKKTDKAEVAPAEAALKEMKKRIIGSAICLVVLMYFTMGHMIGLPAPHWYHGVKNALVAALLQFFLTLPVVYLNRVYYSRGLKALWHRAPNMDSLIAVGSLAALGYGVAALFRMAYGMGHEDWELVQSYSENLYFESAAMILTLITLGKFLETRAKGKTGDAIRSLMDLSPKTASVRRNGEIVEIPVEQRLGVVHEAVSEPAHLPVKGIIFIEKGPDKVLVPGGNDVAALVVPVGFRQDQILRDVAQLRIGEELHPALFLPAVQHQIRGGQQGLGQKIGEIFAEMTVDPVRRQLLAEIFVGGNVLHREGGHGLIVMIDLRNEFRSQPGLQHQGLRLDLVAVEIQRAAGGAQQLVRLLHDDGAAVLPGAHLKHIVDVAVADLNAIGFLIRLEKMEHIHGVPLHILRLH